MAIKIEVQLMILQIIIMEPALRILTQRRLCNRDLT